MKSFVSKLSVFLAGPLIMLSYSCGPTDQLAVDTGPKAPAVEIKGAEPKSADLKPAGPVPAEAKTVEAKPGSAQPVEVKPADTKPVQPKPTEAKPVETKPAEVKPAAPEKESKQPPAVEQPSEQSPVVGQIGDYTIRAKELEEKAIFEVRSNPDQYGQKLGPADVNAVLTKMIAEKAMMMEGWKQNLLEDDRSYNEFYSQNLVGLLLQKQLQDKIEVTDAEIDAKMKANPKLTRGQAGSIIARQKAEPLRNQFHTQLLEQLHVEKLRYNLPKLQQIHHRLLYRPKKERRGYWIMNRQIQEELTEEEKAIVLATFDGGKVTLLDWFEELNMMSPVNRPKDLNTVQGVERLLDRTMKMPIFIAAAKLQGLDKDENFAKRVRERGDKRLLDKVRRRAVAGRERPTKEQIADYFNKHKEEFKGLDTLRIDQIWCEDLKTAQKVKEELNRGKDFASAREQYSLRKEDKQSDTSERTESVFFSDLWKAEPNEIVGPIKGFCRTGTRRQPGMAIKWRIVKMLKKKPGKTREYSSNVEREVKARMRHQEEEAILTKYRKELLRKHSYKVYSERLKDIDPFDIP